MVKDLQHLTGKEQELLLKAPVLVSVLAAWNAKELNQSQKADAIKLAHFKTFTAAPALLPYYNEVNKHFKEDFEIIEKKYFPFSEENRSALKNELNAIVHLVSKLDKSYGALLLKSWEKYANHVRKAGHSVIEDFIFPLPIRGLTG